MLNLNKANLDGLLEDGSFDELSQACFFIYHLSSGEHTQTGVVCEVGVDEYEQGLMRKHENTLSDKEDLLAHYQKVVGVSSSPICLTYSQNKNIDNIVTEIINGEPDLEFLSEDDVAQKVWCVKDPSAQESLIKEYSNLTFQFFYIKAFAKLFSNLRFAFSV